MAANQGPILVGFDATPEAYDALAFGEQLGQLLHRDVECVSIAERSSARGLRDLATERDACLLVVGSTAKSPLGRVLPRSVGRRLLRDAPCLVGIAPRGYRDRRATLRAILVGFDGTDECTNAVQVAADLAQASGALLRVISVVDADVMPHLGPQGATVIQRVREEQAEKVSRLLGRVPVEVHVESQVVCAPVIPELIRQARDADLFVLGSHGYGAVKSALLGDVPSELVDSPPSPLLVVPLESHGPGDDESPSATRRSAGNRSINRPAG
jgi:nucleotide-binding universal stress UspA family protein